MGAVPSDLNLELKRQFKELEEQKAFLMDA